jgi:hypothetical protein
LVRSANVSAPASLAKPLARTGPAR